MNKLAQDEDCIEEFCRLVYCRALDRANKSELNQIQWKKQILSELKLSNISFTKVQHLVTYSKNDFVEDLLQVTRDLSLVKKVRSQFTNKFKARSAMHFSQAYEQNLSKLSHKSSATKKFISMYRNSHKSINVEERCEEMLNSILKNTVYILGLTKGNGVLLEGGVIMTCAHALTGENDKIMKYRCFVNGEGSYGLMKVQPDGVFLDEDVAFANVIQVFESQNKLQGLRLRIPDSLKFDSGFKPIRCIQVGLLFNNQEQCLIKPFETAEGFIQQNLYKGLSDDRLVQQMGLLIHDCYGLWGTSGSPLWNQFGELLGIHNAWNQNGYNVSMMVHDDDTTQCRVVRQYERRAIGVHVLLKLWAEWKQRQKKSDPGKRVWLFEKQEQDQQRKKIKQ